MAETKDPFVDYQSRALTDEEKRWLHEWSRDDLVEVNERLFNQTELHDAGEPVNVRKALEDAGVEVPDEPPNPTYVGAMGSVQQGPLIVEGEDNAGRVPLPRDHEFTVAVEDDAAEDDLVQETEEGKFDTRAVRAEVKTLNNDELRDNLRELGEPVSGNQKELQDRLVKALKKAHDEEQAAE
jgi:hypothetical protein